MGRSTVVIQLADDDRLVRDLSAGGVFVTGCALAITDECELVVRGANDELRLPARVVYVDDERGAGLELIGFSPEVKAQLAALEPIPPLSIARGTRDDAIAVAEAPWADATQDAAGDASRWHGIDDWLGVDDLQRMDALRIASNEPPAIAAEQWDDMAFAELELAVTSEARSGQTEPLPKVDPEQLDGEDFESRTEELRRPNDDDDDDGTPPTAGRERAPRNVHERLRGLNLAAQIKMATTGELHERIVLERLYGKNVWETLLRNPRLSAPEVARIARMGALPRPLIELIVGNSGWLQAPEVRRALLSNPRLGMDQIVKVLRLVPKHELKLAAVQTAYPQTVRQAAKLLLRDA